MDYVLSDENLKSREGSAKEIEVDIDLQSALSEIICLIEDGRYVGEDLTQILNALVQPTHIPNPEHIQSLLDYIKTLAIHNFEEPQISELLTLTNQIDFQVKVWQAMDDGDNL